MRNNQSSRIEALESRQMLSFGQPLPNFGVNGRESLVFDTGNAQLDAMLVDPAGRTTLVSDAGMGRFTSNGKLDTTFGTSGKTKFTGLVVRDAAFDAARRIMVLATNQSGTLLLRFNVNGKTDKSFGNNGATLVTSRKAFVPEALAVDSQGRFVIAGASRIEKSTGTTTQVYRLTSAGAGDSSFDGDGVADLRLGATDLLTPTPTDVVLDAGVVSGDKIVIVGGSQPFSAGGYDPDNGQYFDTVYGDAQLVAARLTSAGALDTAGFGSGGYARTSYNSDALATPATAGKLFADGSFAIASSDSKNRPVVAQFDASGVLQRKDVGPNGFVISVVRDVTSLSDGRLALVGDVTAVSRFGLVTTLDSNGVFGQVVETRDSGHTDALTGTYQKIATYGGDLLIGGTPLSGYSQNRLIKLDAGADTDQPDEFGDGRASDIVFDADGGAHLAYCDATSTHLMYVYRDPNGIWSSAATIDASPLAGQQLSIAVDSSRRPTIAYYDGTNADLKIAQKTDSAWVIQTLDARGTVGQYPSVQYSPKGSLSIAYYNRSTGDLKFVTRESKKWVYETADANGTVGQYATLVFTPKTQRASIAYTDTSGNVKYAVRTDVNKWTLTNVATTTGGAAYLDMSYGGSNNRGAISYYDAKLADLKLAYFDGTNWQSRTIASAGAQGLYSQLYTPLYSNNIYIYSYNKSGDRTSVFSTEWIAPASPTETQIASGFGRYLTVASRTDNSFLAVGYDTADSKLRAIERVLA